MNKRNRIIVILVMAALLLFLIITAPYARHLVSGTGSTKVKLTIFTVLASSVLLSNLIAFYAIPKYFKSRKVIPFIILLVGALVCMFLIQDALRPPAPSPQIIKETLKLPPSAFGPDQIPPFPFPIVFVIFFLPSTFSILMLWTDTIRLKDKAENERLKSELSFLKNQLSPHFLFNSLNTIYALSQKDPKRSGEATLQLSRLLRFLVYDTQKEKTISIKEEIDFLNNYISLNELRLNASTKVQFEYQIDDNDFQIPPLLLLVFVENCFKHGVTSAKQSVISIIINQKQDEIYFETKNNIIEVNSSQGQAGNVGLLNVQRRLELNYPPDAYSFEYFEEGDVFTVKLKLQRI